MAMASRSSVRAFLVEQGGRRLGEAARLRLRVDLRKTGCGESRRARLLGCGEGDRGRGEEGGDKGYLLSWEKRSAHSRRRWGSQGERTYRGE